MPNPFPGMDPYLEGPLWTTVHNNLIEEISRQIAPTVPPAPEQAAWAKQLLKSR